MYQYRQGDVLLVPVASVPGDAKVVKREGGRTAVFPAGAADSEERARGRGVDIRPGCRGVPAAG